MSVVICSSFEHVDSTPEESTGDGLGFWLEIEDSFWFTADGLFLRLGARWSLFLSGFS